MDSGTEEYELNGGLPPGTPGSLDASVRPSSHRCVILPGPVLSGRRGSPGTCGRPAECAPRSHCRVEGDVPLQAKSLLPHQGQNDAHGSSSHPRQVGGM